MALKVEDLALDQHPWGDPAGPENKPEAADDAESFY
jgi:hypothetical protein